MLLVEKEYGIELAPIQQWNAWLKIHSISLHETSKILGINFSEYENLASPRPPTEYILKRLESFTESNFKLVADCIRSLTEANHVFSTLSISHLGKLSSII